MSNLSRDIINKTSSSPDVPTEPKFVPFFLHLRSELSELDLTARWMGSLLRATERFSCFTECRKGQRGDQAEPFGHGHHGTWYLSSMPNWQKLEVSKLWGQFEWLPKESAPGILGFLEESPFIRVKRHNTWTNSYVKEANSPATCLQRLLVLNFFFVLATSALDPRVPANFPESTEETPVSNKTNPTLNPLSSPAVFPSTLEQSHQFSLHLVHQSYLYHLLF